MTDQINTRVDFKKVVILSLLLGVGMFLLKNIASYIAIGRLSYEFFTTLGLNGGMWVVYICIYYYVHAFVLFTIFAYVRNSMPSDYRKAGLFFALALFLLGSAGYSVFKLMVTLTKDLAPDIFSNISIVSFAKDEILSIVSLVFVGLMVAYVFEKLYKKEST